MTVDEVLEEVCEVMGRDRGDLCSLCAVVEATLEVLGRLGTDGKVVPARAPAWEPPGGLVRAPRRYKRGRGAR